MDWPGDVITVTRCDRRDCTDVRYPPICMVWSDATSGVPTEQMKRSVRVQSGGTCRSDGLRVLRDATGAAERHHDHPPAGRAGRVYAPLTQEWGLAQHPARTPGHGALIAVRVMP